MCLTIYFDGQFWVGVFEEPCNGELFVNRHVFGSEPRDNEILELVQQMTPASIRLVKDGPISEHIRENTWVNPKRRARDAAAALKRRGISTRSQETLQRQREEKKTEARRSSRIQREAERERRREIARQKALKRHKGH